MSTASCRGLKELSRSSCRAIIEVTDKSGNTKAVKLDEYPEDFIHLKKYILQNIPAHKVMVLMPHLLMELYQLNEYISPKLIVR